MADFTHNQGYRRQSIHLGDVDMGRIEDISDQPEESVGEEYGEEYFTVKPFQGQDQYCRVCWEKAVKKRRKVHPQANDRSIVQFQCRNGHTWQRIIQHDWRGQ